MTSNKVIYKQQLRKKPDQNTPSKKEKKKLKQRILQTKFLQMNHVLMF